MSPVEGSPRPMLQPPIAFAQHGAGGVEPAGTAEAFDLALRLGATGIDTRAWSTSDGHVVLHPDGQVRRWVVSRKPLSTLSIDELPSDAMVMADLYRRCGTDFDLTLGVEDLATVAAIIAAVRSCEQEFAQPLLARLWLRHGSFPALAELAPLHPEVRFVHTSRLTRLEGGVERHGARLAGAGIAGLAMPFEDWTGGLTVLFHRFEVLTFAGNADHARMLDTLLSMGLDGITSRHPDRMTDAFARAGW